MNFTFSHNQYDQKKDSRLVYLAKRSSARQEGDKDYENLDYQVDLAKRFGLEKLLEQGPSKLHPEVLEKYRDLMNENPTLEKEKNNRMHPIGKFFENVKKGRFINGATRSIEYLKMLLKGTPEQKAEVEKLMDDMIKGRTIGVDEEDRILKELKSFEAKEEASETSDKILLEVGKMGTNADALEISNEVIDRQEEKTNYVPEALPPHAQRDLNYLTELWNRKKSIDSYLQALRFVKKGGKNEKILEAQIKHQRGKIDGIVTTMTGETNVHDNPKALEILRSKIDTFNNNYADKLRTEEKRAQVIGEKSAEVGFDINKPNATLEKNSVRGNVIFTSKKDKVTIKGLNFDPPSEPATTGALNAEVEYIDPDTGKKQITTMSWTNFYKEFVLGLNGKGKGIEEKEKGVPEEGEEYESSFVVSPEEIAKKKTKTKFKIFYVNKEANDGRGEIVLTDKVDVVKNKKITQKDIERGKLKTEKKKSFTFLEFEEFVKKQGYKSNKPKTEKELKDELKAIVTGKALSKTPQGIARDKVAEMINTGEGWDKNLAALEMEGKDNSSTGASTTSLGDEGDEELSPLETDEGAPKLLADDIYREALDYKEIHKVGDMDKKEPSWIKQIWRETRVLSVSDVWSMGKLMWEYYVRRWERRQKERYSYAGQNMPFWDAEMRRVNQAAENEEVNQFKESFEQKGIFEIEERLQQTKNRDELKACFVTLSDKGKLRMDDVEMWKNLNRFVDAKYAIPIPYNGDPATWVSDDPESPDYMKTGLSYLQDAIDSLWGEGTYNDWYQKNKSTYESGVKSYYAEGKSLEGVQGGHERKLAELLKIHKNGGYVDPHEYEGLIQHMIDAGKSQIQYKMYYMIEGVAAVNGHGRTILTFDRIAHLNSEMLNQFPMLEYLCAQVKRPDGEIHRWTKDDYISWVKSWDSEDPMNAVPNQKVSDFLWRHVLPSDKTQNRVNKALRNADKLDHDDMFAYLPPASTQIITNTCRTVGGGGKHLLTVEGYANGCPGFSQYIKDLARYDNPRKLISAVKSYVRFEAIMMKRWKRDHDDYFRMEGDDELLNGSTIVSNEPPSLFFGELNSLIKQIANSYDDPRLKKAVDLIYTDMSGYDKRNKSDRDKQASIQYELEQFDNIFNNAIKEDGGERLSAIVNQSHLTGMTFRSWEDIERARQKKGLDSNSSND